VGHPNRARYDTVIGGWKDSEQHSRTAANDASAARRERPDHWPTRFLATGDGWFFHWLVVWVTGPSVEILVFLLAVEHFLVLAAPVNLADPASARPSDVSTFRPWLN